MFANNVESLAAEVNEVLKSMAGFITSIDYVRHV